MSIGYKSFHENSIRDPKAFWSEQAKLVDWHQPFSQVLDYSNPPFAKWFVGGQTNLCHNAVDRHLKDRANQIALVAVSTETNQEHAYTFIELHDEVNRMAAILQANGVKKGDRVLIYMPMVPAAVSSAAGVLAAQPVRAKTLTVASIARPANLEIANCSPIGDLQIEPS